MQKQVATVVLLTLLLACSSSAARPHPDLRPPQYVVTQFLPKLNWPDGGYGPYESIRINQSNQVIGTLEEHGMPADDVMHTALFWQHGRIFTLHPLPNYRNSFANDLNDRGQVIVDATTTAGPGSRALLWVNGNLRALKLLPGTRNSSASVINNKGQIVGQCNNAISNSSVGVRTTACLWQNGKAYALKLLPGTKNSNAYSINDREQIVGTCDDTACLWQKGKVYSLGLGDAEEIDDAGHILISQNDPSGDAPDQNWRWEHYLLSLWSHGRRTFVANGVDRAYLNKRGQVAFGHYFDLRDGLTRGYVWERDKMHDLKIPSKPGDKSKITVNGLNDSSKVVGRVYIESSQNQSPGNYTKFAFLWQHGKMYSLNDLLVPPVKMKLYEAKAINNRGQIVCTTDDDRLVVLSPVSR